jgi:hypothetical protein
MPSLPKGDPHDPITTGPQAWRCFWHVVDRHIAACQRVAAEPTDVPSTGSSNRRTRRGNFRRGFLRACQSVGLDEFAGRQPGGVGEERRSNICAGSSSGGLEPEGNGDSYFQPCR